MNNILFKINNDYDYDCYCSCGYQTTIRRGIYYYTNSLITCTKCGTKYVKTVGSNIKKSCSGKVPRFETEYCKPYGFKVIRIDDVYKFDVITKTITKTDTECKRELVVNFKTNEFYVTDAKGNKLKLLRENISSFLDKKTDALHFINTITKDCRETNNALKAIYYDSRYNVNVLENTIIKFVTSPQYNILANCGFEYDFLKSAFISTYYSAKDNTQPHKILGVEKYMINYIKHWKSWSNSYAKVLNWINDNYGASNTKYMLELMDGDNFTFAHSFSNLETLLKVKGYDFKRLMKYLFIDVKHQGICNSMEALNFLTDTIRLADQLKVELKEKYPRSLKMAHDIFQMNYNSMKKTINSQAFEEKQEEWNDKYKYSNKEFSIIIPKTPQEIVLEGSRQSNCVASYVDDVVKGKCTILFLRRTSAKDISEVTIEARGNAIVQVKAFANSKVNKDHQKFLTEWAKKKNLRLVY